MKFINQSVELNGTKHFSTALVGMILLNLSFFKVFIFLVCHQTILLIVLSNLSVSLSIFQFYL